MKNHNFIGIVILFLIVLAVQSIIGIVRLGYVTAKGIYGIANPQSPAIPTVVAYAPIFEAIEPINEPIKPVAQTFEPVTADPWVVKSRKPRAKSIAQLIQEEAS